MSTDRTGTSPHPGGAETAVADAVDALGGLDGIVHAVGMSGRRLGDGPVTAVTDEGWSEILRVNLESAMRLMRVGIPVLRDSGGGSFVTVGSMLGQSADRDFLTAAYAASKAGLLGLTRTAALEAAAVGRPGQRDRRRPDRDTDVRPRRRRSSTSSSA